MSDETEQFGAMSYYWDGKLDGLSGYPMDEDSKDDPEYVAGHKAGSAMVAAKKATT